MNILYKDYDSTMPIKKFDLMTQKEVEEHFKWFINQIPVRIEILKEAVAEDKTIPFACDYSSESLISLWNWYITKISIVSKSEDELSKELDNIKEEWIRESIIRNSSEKISAQTAAICLDVGIYFGETLIHNHNSLYWGYYTKPKRDIFVNRPVIQGFKSNMRFNPAVVVFNLTWQYWWSDKEKYRTLYDMYLNWERCI